MELQQEGATFNSQGLRMRSELEKAVAEKERLEVLSQSQATELRQLKDDGTGAFDRAEATIALLTREGESLRAEKAQVEEANAQMAAAKAAEEETRMACERANKELGSEVTRLHEELVAVQEAAHEPHGHSSLANEFLVRRPPSGPRTGKLAV